MFCDCGSREGDESTLDAVVAERAPADVLPPADPRETEEIKLGRGVTEHDPASGLMQADPKPDDGPESDDEDDDAPPPSFEEAQELPSTPAPPQPTAAEEGAVTMGEVAIGVADASDPTAAEMDQDASPSEAVQGEGYYQDENHADRCCVCPKSGCSDPEPQGEWRDLW